MSLPLLFIKMVYIKLMAKVFQKEELMDVYNSLIIEFNLFSIEDPFDEEDSDSFKKLGEAQYRSLGSWR